MIKGTMSESLHIRGIMSKEFSAIRCLDFNGSTDYVNCGNDASLRNADTFSVEAWFKNLDINNFRTIFSGSNSQGTAGFCLYLHSNQIRFYVSKVNVPDAWKTQIAYKSFTDTSNWYHIIGTYNKEKIRIFLNLIEGTSYNYSESVDVTYDKLIGKWIGVAYFNGSICGVRYYNNKALNATERQNNFNGKITQDGLVAEWLMREQQGNIIHDTSVNSNHGTIYGADWYEEKFNTPLKGIMSNSSEIKGIMTAEYI